MFAQLQPNSKAQPTAMMLLRLLTLTASCTALSSPFLGTRVKTSQVTSVSTTWRMYDDDAPDAFTALTNTEEWISKTLRGGQGSVSNPYSRKEVTYLHEPQKSHFLILASVFRQLRKARIAGEEHAALEMERQDALDEDDNYEPKPLRQTHVLVVPANPTWNKDFLVFDQVVQAINDARREARHYVTNGDDVDWNVAVNLAHLHPDFGKPTLEQELQAMKDEEEAGEVDLNYQHWKEQKIKARQSPYPTLVVEVRAMPPPAQYEHYPEHVLPSDPTDIAKLERLFQTAATQISEDTFWDQVAEHVPTVPAQAPLDVAQEWLAPRIAAEARVSITESPAKQVDEAYEFCFLNMDMLMHSTEVQAQYCVLPDFVPTAATSLEKFAQQCATLSGDKVQVTTYHPEHVDPERRSPIPILCLQRQE